MAEEIRVGAVIEPTLPVANGLLDVARRLSADLGPRASELAWVPPHRYVAPLAVGPAAEPVSDASLVEALRNAVKDLEEFGVQLAPPVLVREGPGAGRVVTVVSSKGDELAAVARLLVERLGETGLDVVTPEPVAFTLALVAGDALLDAVEAVLPPGRDAPLAGWLVGGICVHQGPTTHEGRGWAASRLRFAPLRRLGSRR